MCLIWVQSFLSKCEGHFSQKREIAHRQLFQAMLKANPRNTSSLVCPTRHPRKVDHDLPQFAILFLHFTRALFFTFALDIELDLCQSFPQLGNFPKELPLQTSTRRRELRRQRSGSLAL